MIRHYKKCMSCNGAGCPKCKGVGVIMIPHEIIISKMTVFARIVYLGWAYCLVTLFIIAIAGCGSLDHRAMAGGMTYLADKWSAKPMPQPDENSYQQEPIMNQIYRSSPRCETIRVMDPNTYMYSFQQVCR